ncbi:MAG: protein kinase [Bryobacterales bacterium]|nr:protein kinase [Bryobacterales bacterium]
MRTYFSTIIARNQPIIEDERGALQVAGFVTKDNWQRVEEIFYAVVEAPADRQPQVLEEACAGDHELLSAVRNLLDADQRQNDTIPRAIRGMMVSVAEPLNVGQRIGAYEVEREIGHGGMGAVYLAFRADDEFQKRVAIKLLRRGLEQPELLARFRQERQILAALDHPYIARLVDGGATEDGRPYLIMDYAEGQSITDYCEQRRLPLAGRCLLFGKVCEAVAHAHRNLVVHRDLKPGNILITPDGLPKLLDFGIAKLLDPSPGERREDTTTLTGMLTPSYASPEQVLGEKITTASDVYSLGAVLFEVLSGQTAYQFANFSPQEIVRVVCEHEPHYGRLPEELDSIVRKAMRKDPHERYASVEALREDLDCYVNGRPVKARAYSLLYHSGKFVRRHWLGVSAAVIATVSLVATTIYAVGQAQRAERRFAQVRQLSNKFLFDFHDSIAHLPGATGARQQVVRTAIEYLDSLAKEATGDAALLSELATAYERVGDVQGNPYHSNLGDAKGAYESYARAMSLRREIGKSADRPASFPEDLLHSALKLADMHSIMGQTAEAERLLSDSIAEFHAGASSARIAGARLYVRRGDVRDKQGRIGEAVDDYRRAVTLIESGLTGQPDAKLWNELSSVKRRLGERLPSVGDRAGARVQLESALAFARKTVEHAEGNAEYVRNRMTAALSLGTYLLQEGDASAAQQHFENALSIAQLLAASDAKNVQASSDLAVVHSRLGDLHSSRGQYQEALAEYEKAVEAAAKASSAGDGNLRYQRDAAYHRLSLGNVAAELKQYDRALREIGAGLNIVDALIARDPRDQDNYLLRAQALRDVAAVHASKRDWNRAIAENQRALEALGQAPVFRRYEGSVCQQLGTAYQELAHTAVGPQKLAHVQEALTWWKRARTAQMEMLKVDGDSPARREELKRIDAQIRLLQRTQ